MKSRYLFTSLPLFVTVFAGCTSQPSNTNAPSSSSAGGTVPAAVSTSKQLHLALVANSTAPFWLMARKGAEKAGTELPNVTVDVKLPPQGTAAEQTTLVTDLSTNGLDGLAISPVDPSNQTELLNQIASQSLVFTQDSDAPKSNRACYIGSDNVAMGRQIGEELMKALPQGGKVMIFVGKKDAQNARDRYQGLQEAIQGSKIQILDTRTDDTDLGKAKTNVSDALVANPDLAACVGLWGYNGPAAMSAVEDANLVGKVKIVCVDEEDDTLRGVKNGTIFATVVQQPYQFGYLAMVDMAKYLRGDKSVIPASKAIYVPTKVITQANVDGFAKQVKQYQE